MEKLIKMPSIGQFRNAVHDLQHQVRFVGVDEAGEAIYDKGIQYPTVAFKGTCKIHGTNASYCLDIDGNDWFQSKGNVLSIEKDNAGFCFFGTARKEEFTRMACDLVLKIGELEVGERTVTLYGEFCGGNIQKGVAVSGLDKMFVLFGAKLSHANVEDGAAEWVDISTIECDHSKNIYNINDFPTWKIAVNLAEPAEAQNTLINLTEEVERICPIGAFFGRTDPESEDYNTIGEGIVWECSFNGSTVRFKVKGEKHSSSKVKKLASVDPEKMANIKEFVEYSVTENRLNQGVEQVFAGGPAIIGGTGDFVKWVKGDVIKEELDTMVASGLEMREVAGPISKKAANWFKEYLNKQSGLI